MTFDDVVLVVLLYLLVFLVERAEGGRREGRGCNGRGLWEEIGGAVRVGVADDEKSRRCAQSGWIMHDLLS